MALTCTCVQITCHRYRIAGDRCGVGNVTGLQTRDGSRVRVIRVRVRVGRSQPWKNPHPWHGFTNPWWVAGITGKIIIIISESISDFFSHLKPFFYHFCQIFLFHHSVTCSYVTCFLFTITTICPTNDDDDDHLWHLQHQKDDHDDQRDDDQRNQRRRKGFETRLPDTS